LHINFVEIANFRKLLSTRVDLSEATTLFVGANNSGKSSAMLALRRFLVPQRCSFELHDFTLCHWPSIDAIGQSWISANQANEVISLDITPWEPLLPTLDLWLNVASGEMHRVRDLIPTLDWEGGTLGVRLRYEPDDLSVLYKDFIAAIAEAENLRATASAQQTTSKPPGTADPTTPPKLTLWPATLVDYLSRRLSRHFKLRAYTLDPAQLKSPAKSQAQLQSLTASSLPIDGDPLKGLVRVHDIPAQRGFGEEPAKEDDDGASSGPPGSRLSDQLRSYYSKHLDPAKGPDAKDLGALQAIEAAQDAFDQRLTESFAEAFLEVEGMGYPGVSDPRPKVSTRLKAIDGLNHAAAVTFMVDVTSVEGEVTPLLRLPENNNGLGYQNLISMIFRLMSFRDAWMRVGKAIKATQTIEIEPLHLVLIEEPEAHLHAQVQQVFVKKAYAVLRQHDELKGRQTFRTQLIVSTHSSHVAHEIPFANLRYFRRLPAGMVARIPVSTVINLQDVFGTMNDTQRFVTRYLRAHHADLFFADAAVLVEGPAERMLLPNFIRNNYERLNQSYVTLLEIGGSHAHRLKPLIDCLGLLTLIITDLDSVDATGSSVQPQKGADQKTNNDTLKTWVPELVSIDALMDAEEKTKISENSSDQLFAVRVAYQVPLQVKLSVASKAESIQPYTFEDALVFENLEFFSKLEGGGLVRKFREAIVNGGDVGSLGKAMFDALRTGKKAEFALEIIDAKEFDTIKVPSYIAEGLAWLQSRLEKKQVEILPKNGDAKI
jgi:predicted ATP-dependent endonuclease of OLD family